MKIEKTTPRSTTLNELGRRLAQMRKQRGFTQTELSREAGLGVATLRRIEDGQDAQIGSWVKLLKALEMTSAVDTLLPETIDSPMSEVKSGSSRVRKARMADDSARPPVWGDELE